MITDQNLVTACILLVECVNFVQHGTKTIIMWSDCLQLLGYFAVVNSFAVQRLWEWGSQLLQSGV